MSENENNNLNNPVDDNPESERDQIAQALDKVENEFNSDNDNKLRMRYSDENDDSMEERLNNIKNALSNFDKD